MDQFQGRLLLVEPDQSYNAVLELERWERDRSNHELALIVEAVNRLLQTLPQGQISLVQAAHNAPPRHSKLV